MKKEEVLVLKLRSIIADKELAVCAANRDLAMFGNWPVDYNTYVSKLNEEIFAILNEIENLQ